MIRLKITQTISGHGLEIGMYGLDKRGSALRASLVLNSNTTLQY